MLTQWSCFICGEVGSIHVGWVAGYSLRECSRCHLQFLDCRLSKENTGKIYSDYYKAWDLDNYREEVCLMKTKTFEGYLRRVTPFVSGGRLLDIGCATGELLEVAQLSGFEVYGIEISPQGYSVSMKKFGESRIFSKELQRENFPPDYFDVITLSDVIEHIPEPASLLETIHRILKPSGILMIVTPDTSSLTKKIMRKKWLHYKHEHLFYYSADNMSRFLSPYFNLVYVEPARKTLSINYLMSVLEAYTETKILHRCISLIKKLPVSVRRRLFTVPIGEILILAEHKPHDEVKRRGRTASDYGNE